MLSKFLQVHTSPYVIITTARKDTFFSGGRRATLGKRAWVQLHADLRDALLIFHQPADVVGAAGEKDR